MGSSRKKRTDPPPVFFLDRSLGRYEITDAIVARGYEVHTLWSVYGDDQEEWVEDEVWIEEGALAGWILLSKDDVRYNPGFDDLMDRCAARVFFLSRQDLPGPTQVAWFMANLNRIIQRARKPGPYAWAVYEDTIIKRYP